MIFKNYHSKGLHHLELAFVVDDDPRCTDHTQAVQHKLLAACESLRDIMIDHEKYTTKQKDRKKGQRRNVCDGRSIEPVVGSLGAVDRQLGAVDIQLVAADSTTLYKTQYHQKKRNEIIEWRTRYGANKKRRLI